MKKLLKVSLLLVLAVILATTVVNAATSADLVAYLTKSHTVAGKSVQLSASDRLKVERYLGENPVTDEQAAQIIAKVDEAIKVMNDAGVSDVTKLSQADKNKIISIASEAAGIAGLTISYDSSLKTVSIYKDGKLVESIATNTGKLVQTGATNYAYVVVPVVAIIAVAAIFVVKKGKVNA